MYLDSRCKGLQVVRVRSQPVWGGACAVVEVAAEERGPTGRGGHSYTCVQHGRKLFIAVKAATQQPTLATAADLSGACCNELRCLQQWQSNPLT